MGLGVTMLASTILQLILHILALTQDHEVTVLPGSNAVPPSTIGRVERLARAGLARLSPSFPGAHLLGLEIYVHADLESVPETVREHLQPGIAGLALLDRNQIYLLVDRARSQPPGDLRNVVDHELVHMLLHRYVADYSRFVPRWFHEGLAQDLSGATYLGVSEEDIIVPAKMRRLLRFRDLRTGFPDDDYSLHLAYAQSFSYVAFLRRKFGLPTLLRAARAASQDQWFRGGFLAVTGAPLIHQEELWLDYLENNSGALWRRLQNDCFYYLMIPAAILLAWATRRAILRDRRSKSRLEHDELDDASPNDE